MNNTIEDLDGLIQKFREEKTRLETMLAETNDRLKRITRAIQALESPPDDVAGPATLEAPKGPSVADMAWKAIEQMHNGTTFDYHSLRDKVVALYQPDPALYGRIKMGIYPAVKFLQKHNKVERCPGGFRAIRQVAEPAH